jgi:predicted nucleotidyltransferase
LANGEESLTPKEAIDLAVRRLVAVAKPKKVILFGSHADGTATEESDVDLLVVEPVVPSKRQEMIRLRKAVGSVGVPVDVLLSFA